MKFSSDVAWGLLGVDVIICVLMKYLNNSTPSITKQTRADPELSQKADQKTGLKGQPFSNLILIKKTRFFFQKMLWTCHLVAYYLLEQTWIL